MSDRRPAFHVRAPPQALARNFAKTEMIPHAAHYDRTMEYPHAVFKKACVVLVASQQQP